MWSIKKSQNDNVIIKENIENKMEKFLNNIEYGTLALSDMNKPYSVPLNFVLINDNIYFHGSKKGKKIEILKLNKFVSFSAVEPYSIIPSFFSSKKGMACPATHFFKSIIIDGIIEFVFNYEEKVLALSKLMEKLQPEGNYERLDTDSYKKSINRTFVFKLIPQNFDIKIKFGKRLSNERLEMILEHLKERNSEKDRLTIKLMNQYRNNNLK